MNAELIDAEKARAEREASVRLRAVQQLAERAIRSYLLAQERRHREKDAGEERTVKETDVHRGAVRCYRDASQSPFVEEGP